MNDNDIKTLPQVRAFLDGTQAVEFSLHTQSERYDFVRRTLIRFAYQTRSKPDKGAAAQLPGSCQWLFANTAEAANQSRVKAPAISTRHQRRQWLYSPVHRRRPAPAGSVG